MINIDFANHSMINAYPYIPLSVNPHKKLIADHILSGNIQDGAAIKRQAGAAGQQRYCQGNVSSSLIFTSPVMPFRLTCTISAS
jgi:hypothetical protein